MSVARRICVFGLVLGCASEPTSLDDCSLLTAVVEREDCRLRFLAPLFERGGEEALREGLRALEDPVSRDLVRLRLAVGSPHRAGSLCREVETPDARAKCQQVLGRPHLRAPRP